LHWPNVVGGLLPADAKPPPEKLVTRNVPILEQILSSAPDAKANAGATLGTHRVRAIDVRHRSAFEWRACTSPVLALRRLRLLLLA
jgi:hypothetical protein